MSKTLNSISLAQAKLALSVIPIVSRQEAFALKGGAAINFFLTDIPRLSIDLDLCYLPLQPRKESLEGIAASMRKIGDDFLKIYSESEIQFANKSELGTSGTLRLKTHNTEIKIEPNFVLRGNFLPVTRREARDVVKELVSEAPTIQTLSPEEIYAGKICAALDRQLPRDLFDIKQLIDSSGLTPALKDALVVYLLYQGRPIEELLSPSRLLFDERSISNLQEISRTQYSLEELVVIREDLIRWVNEALTDRDKDFLVSVMIDQPKWDYAPFPDLERFPGIQWKLQNVKKMDSRKRQEAVRKLEATFGKN